MPTVYCLFFFKQKTAYEMRISDWSSDVCSSDLRSAHLREAVELALVELERVVDAGHGGRVFQRGGLVAGGRAFDLGQVVLEVRDRLRMAPVDRVLQIGRASCRERVCQYV